PDDAEPESGFVSVLSPLGTALLGLRAGEVASWRGADGQESQLVVHTVDYQPEASGDYLA
ncbi:MAG TPA: GreA/GreB family elongation factor, partial [Ottowia sp.]|nr:GreA/GreB family elongation factor [Ottowia sp.]